MKRTMYAVLFITALFLFAGCGEDVKAGKNGSNALTVFTEEAAGENCADGGTKVDTGIDSDGDGTLSAEEIQATEYICNGENGTDGTNGTDGVDGEDGKDGTNGTDGVDGIDGKDGEPGLDGEDGIDGKDGEPGLDGENGIDGKDGEPGKDGENGIDGKDGEPGLDGEPGADGACAGNNAPVINSITINGNVFSGTPVEAVNDSKINIKASATDADGDVLNYKIVSTWNIVDNGAGDFDLTTDEIGLFNLTLVVSDGCNITIKSFSVITTNIFHIKDGQTVELSGTICHKTIIIDGKVNIPAYDGIGPDSGMLKLVAENIIVGVNGEINADHVGYKGGIASPQNTMGGFCGEGPGKGCAGGPGSGVGQGGSGAGYGGTGNGPNNSWGNDNPCPVCSESNLVHCEGAPGVIYGTDMDIDIEMGSGGGAGGNSAGCSNSGGFGGNGGGKIIILANESVEINGKITAKGQNPLPDSSGCGYRPGGGGGSGGGILIAADKIKGSNLSTLNVSGGQGGESLGDISDSSWGWAGGGGGGGRIKLFTPDNQWLGTYSVSGGLGGTAPATAQSYAGDPGADGVYKHINTIPAEFDNLSCF